LDLKWVMLISMIKNAFQLPESFTLGSLPLKEGLAPSLFQGPFPKISQPLTKVLNLLDTQTTDGLSVHLQSPALKRRYWQRQHAKEYERLKALFQHAEWIRQTLEARGCLQLKNSFDRDMLHFQQLDTLYARLTTQEEALLNPFETWVFQQVQQLQRLFNSLKASFKQGWDVLVDSKENARHLQAQRLLQQWVFHLCQRHRQKGMAADLLQDVYILQQRQAH
jgi:hypothetical protein